MIPDKKYKCSGDGLLPSLVTKIPNSCYTTAYSKPVTESTRLQHARYPYEHTTRSSHAQRQYNPTKSNILTSFGVPYRTPLHVLAVTQEPFLRANTWVYSHKPKVYNRLLGPWFIGKKRFGIKFWKNRFANSNSWYTSWYARSPWQQGSIQGACSNIAICSSLVKISLQFHVKRVIQNLVGFRKVQYSDFCSCHGSRWT